MYIRDRLKDIYIKFHFFYNDFYDFNEKIAQDIFFLKDKKYTSKKLSKVEEVIYCFWTGNNEMSLNRQESLNSLKENSNVSVILITPHNLDDYILKDFPLHPAYNYLSNVHKSDYLRCYFMHHYGGGYSDIKRNSKSWKSSFNKINNSNKIALGYREISVDGVAYINGAFNIKNFKKINYDMRRHYPYLIGNCGYIFRPYTVFTNAWINELHRRLDLVQLELKNNPGNIMGDNLGYPIIWNSILGQIFHPLCLKYHKDIIKDDHVKPEFSNYR